MYGARLNLRKINEALRAEADHKLNLKAKIIAKNAGVHHTHVYKSLKTTGKYVQKERLVEE